MVQLNLTSRYIYSYNLLAFTYVLLSVQLYACLPAYLTTTAVETELRALCVPAHPLSLNCIPKPLKKDVCVCTCMCKPHM